MMADNAEIERQLEAEAHDNNCVEQVLLEDKYFDVRKCFA